MKPSCSSLFWTSIINVLTVKPGKPPQARWEGGGFLPRLPESLEQLDLLLLTVAKSRKVRPDGIHFQGLRYLDLTLAAYVGESVIIRYDPRDMAEIRIFHDQRFLCRAICAELAGETIALRDIMRTRNRRRRDLRQTLQDARPHRRSPLGSPSRRSAMSDEPTVTDELAIPPVTTPADVTTPRLKRYIHE